MVSNAQDPSSPRSPGRLWLIVAICGVVFVQVVYGLLVFWWLGPKMDVRGQFGDIFGGVNALFTGLAFAGVIYTILLQRRELELQREEFKLNRAELIRSAQAQMDQVSRLEEAADLSAITSLLNVYGALVQPMWKSTEAERIHIEELRSRLEAPRATPKEKAYYSSALEEAHQNLRLREAPYSDALEKRKRLVKRLETLVEQRSQDKRAVQETE